MEQSPSSVQQEFNLGQWALKAQVARGNTNSRRFSTSYIERQREEARSFRSNRTISSTASSPGYTLREEIDPSTYSFTTALQGDLSTQKYELIVLSSLSVYVINVCVFGGLCTSALQARYGYNSWDCLSPDGFALNSKWNEAEKYICNPHSGEVPLECLSAKTLSARSFRNYTSRTFMSAPLVYSFQSKQIHTRSCVPSVLHFPIQEAKDVEMVTKDVETITMDVGIQSTLPELQSNSSSFVSSQKIIKSLLKQCEEEGRDSPNFTEKMKREKKVVENKGRSDGKRKEKEGKEKEKGRWRRSTQGGCLSWMTNKNKPRKKNMCLPLPHLINGC
ncbi:uncharacterized protein LOC120002010 isoform X2 [Tripterygium wilfordii]|uniref:uncharacterized protein LOC120002010 isoform X2 n=1 Tax=Tripterygium wilfordii TaxID=458696 RepID=UPI0018F82F63|nr:uncharacterized protein LOC120002010 isoform X2 [Tripterygium wilfordii]